MRVTFRCKRSGNTVSFSNLDDIAQLRLHEGYDEVKDEKESSETTNAADAPDETKGTDEEVLNSPVLSVRVDKRSKEYRKLVGR